MHPSGGSSVFQGRPRGIRARPRGRGGYQTRSSFEEDGIGHTITDTATLGNNRYNDHQGIAIFSSSYSCFLRSTSCYSAAQGGSGGRGGFNRFKRGRYDSGYDNNQGTRPPKPTTDSICVTRIPPELNTIDKLNEHFKKFGSIVNIQVIISPKDLNSTVGSLYRLSPQSLIQQMVKHSFSSQVTKERCWL